MVLMGEEFYEDKQWSDYGPGDPRGDIKALQHAKKVAKLMRENLAGEMTPRTRPDVFLKPALAFK